MRLWLSTLERLIVGSWYGGWVGLGNTSLSKHQVGSKGTEMRLCWKTLERLIIGVGYLVFRWGSCTALTRFAGRTDKARGVNVITDHHVNHCSKRKVWKLVTAHNRRGDCLASCGLLWLPYCFVMPPQWFSGYGCHAVDGGNIFLCFVSVAGVYRDYLRNDDHMEKSGVKQTNGTLFASS